MIVLTPEGTLSLDLSQDTPVRDAMLLSMFVPLGSRLQRPDFGSELHTLRNSGAIAARTESLAIRMVRRAHQWMIDLDLLDSIDVVATLSKGSSSNPRIVLFVDGHTSFGTVHVDYWIPVPNSEVP